MLLPGCLNAPFCMFLAGCMEGSFLGSCLDV